MSSPETARRFCAGWLDAIGLAVGLLDEPGTTLAPSDDRLGSGLAVCYRLGAHRVIMIDPNLTDQLAPLADTTVAHDNETIGAFAAGLGWTFAAAGLQKTLVAPFDRDTRLATDAGLAEFTLHRFDWSHDADRALVRGLVETSAEDELDDAEIELDHLDEHAAGILDGAGRLAAFASLRPWMYGAFGDIGVLTRADVRGRGLGQAVVSGLIADVMPTDWEPLYRHDVTNIGSDRLSAGLGFTAAAAFVAVGPTAPA